MKLAILANAQAKEEWLSKPGGNAELSWASSLDELCSMQADAWFDLDFDYVAGGGPNATGNLIRTTQAGETDEGNDVVNTVNEGDLSGANGVGIIYGINDRISKLASIQGPVFINSVIQPLIDSEFSAASTEDAQFIRINAWPTFLQRPLIEVAIADPFAETTVREVFQALGWKHWIVPDVPGMISPRVIAMIINEAYYTLQEEVSTKEEIDTAMKLGTNYPYGPFEWSNKIGLRNIHALLTALSKTDMRYLPCEKLKQDAGAALVTNRKQG